MKKALISGITGQDGSYLAEHLLNNNYEVHGIIRRTSSINTNRIDHLLSNHQNDNLFHLHYGDLLDSTSISALVNKIKPDEIYNLGAQSHVAVSFKLPDYTSSTSVVGSLSFLESIKHLDKLVKYYQASSSEMYGGVGVKKLNEESIFEPKSPYAAGKLFAHNLTKIYRESYNLFCVNGILFNHESPRRGETFVTRKITRAATRIYFDIQSKLSLGNLEAKRDWGYAKDFVEGMHLMMQQDFPSDWVLATGETYSVKDFLNEAFGYLNLDWEKYVEISERLFRPNEVDHLLGDYTKAEKELGWKPKTDFKTLVKIMIEEDLKLAEQEQLLVKNGLLNPTWEHFKL